MRADNTADIRETRIGSSADRVLVELPAALTRVLGEDPSHDVRMEYVLNRLVGLTERAIRLGAGAVRYDAATNTMRLDPENWPFTPEACQRIPPLRPDLLLQNARVVDFGALLKLEGIGGIGLAKTVTFASDGSPPVMTTWADAKAARYQHLSHVHSVIDLYELLPEGCIGEIASLAVGMSPRAMQAGMGCGYVEDQYSGADEPAWPLASVSFDTVAEFVPVDALFQHSTETEAQVIKAALAKIKANAIARSALPTLPEYIGRLHTSTDDWEELRAGRADGITKLHVYCETMDDVSDVIERVYPIVVRAGALMKAKTAARAHDMRPDAGQGNKGVVVYLPLDRDPQRLTKQIASALAGYRYAHKGISGDHFYGNGVSYLTDKDITGRYVGASIADPGPQCLRPMTRPLAHNSASLEV